MRIGLHHGAATERDGTLDGQAVHAASRVMSEAVGGQILVTAAVRDAVEALGNRIEQVDLGFWRARMLADRDLPGDREAAAALAAGYRELGLPRHAEAAAGLGLGN